MKRNWRSHGEAIYVELGPHHLWWMIPATALAILTTLLCTLGTLYWIVDRLT